MESSPAIARSMQCHITNHITVHEIGYYQFRSKINKREFFVTFRNFVFCNKTSCEYYFFIKGKNNTHFIFKLKKLYPGLHLVSCTVDSYSYSTPTNKSMIMSILSTDNDMVEKRLRSINRDRNKGTDHFPQGLLESGTSLHQRYSQRGSET